MGPSTLVPKHLQDFLKRLRRKIEPRQIRFFAVGEYGGETERPHYHAALFNMDTCLYGRSRYSKLCDSCCSVCDMVRDTWGHGHVYLGQVQRQSAGYLAGYVTKKMTSTDDVRLCGRYPEFARMSNRPGVGAAAMEELARIVRDYPRFGAPDVPGALRHGDKSRPLGRYLMRQIRKHLGRDEKAPPQVLEAMALELLPLRQAAFEASTSFKKAYVEAIEGRLIQVKHRSEIFRTRRVL